MATTESEESKTVSSLLEDPPSSSTPLLFKHFPSSPVHDEETQQQQHPDQSPPDPTQFLQITYNYGPRPFKDLPFLVLFLLFFVSTFAFGIFSICNRNSNFSSLSSYSYSSNSSSCVKSSSLQSDSLKFHSLPLNSDSLLTSSTFLRDLIWTLVITLFFSVPFALMLLLLLKHYTKQIVYVSLPFFVVMPVFFNVYWFVACTVSDTCSEDFPLVYRIIVLLFVFLVIGIVVWIFVVNWHRIELTISIIGIASDALWRNLALFGVLLCLNVALLVYFVPIIVFLVFARQNGDIVASDSDGEYSCVWKQDSWVPAYYTLAILTMLWSAAVTGETHVYVISGAIAQWYFSMDDDAKLKRNIRSSLRNAFGPSSGTICLSGLLVCVVRVIRAAVDSARQEDVPGFVNVVLRCCVNAFLAAVDFLNKFTINFAAITGEAYCSSARMTYELLKRNLLSAVFVETVSTRILAGIVFVVSAIYAIAACAILKAATSLGADSYFVAALAWLVLILVLAFFVSVLDNVIDTVYICYAIDRDKGEVCKQDVHEVYVNLPISRNHRSSLPSRTLDV